VLREARPRNLDLGEREQRQEFRSQDERFHREIDPSLRYQAREARGRARLMEEFARCG
jgi:hypothetical protein